MNVNIKKEKERTKERKCFNSLSLNEIFEWEEEEGKNNSISRIKENIIHSFISFETNNK